MKRIIRCLLSLVLLCLLLPSLSAFAEQSAEARGMEKLKTAVNRECVVLPKKESWLEEWKTLYGRRAWYAPSLFVEAMPLVNCGVPMPPPLFEGTKVTVLAEENDMSFILYYSTEYLLCAGWIQSIRLLEDFPGSVYNIGVPWEGETKKLDFVQNTWSYGCLPGTEQRYTVLAEPVKNCVGFTLDYQLIAENTSSKWMLWGPRTVWVSDGEKWTALGCFDYAENGTVRVQVWLPEPMDVVAIATWAHCHAPNIFDFRQWAENFQIAQEEAH